MVFHPTGKDQHSPELPPVQDETECRGQQALPAPQAAQLLAGAGQDQEVCRGQQALPAPQAQAAQLLIGVGLDEEDGGQQLPVPQALQQPGGGGGCGWGPRGTAGAGGHDVDVGLTAAPSGY